MTAPEHLQGPWAAFLLDEDGFAYSCVEEIAADRRNEEFQVAIVRRSASPKPVGFGEFRVAGFTVPADLIWVREDELGLAGNDSFLGAAAWLERAQAMAAGLNAVG